jgi:WD40 repeat protein
VRLWNLPSGGPVGVLTGHEDGVSCLAVSPDGQLLASAGYDGEVRLWHLTLRAASRTPAAEVDLAAVERLRDSGPGGQVRVWANLISELAWRRRMTSS